MQYFKKNNPHTQDKIFANRLCKVFRSPAHKRVEVCEDANDDLKGIQSI